jgi:hypothetical protein
VAELEIKLQTLDGVWETVGVDRYPGIWPENFTASSDQWGYATCSFTLKRPTDTQHPDLSSFTPCECYVGGNLIWDGRVRETPTSDGPDGQINVSGVGWQAQLDDDQYHPLYVRTDLTVWQDVRSKLTADLTKFRSAPQTEVGAGGIVLTFPNGFADATGDAVGVVIDLGDDPKQWAKRIVLLVEHTGNGHGNVELRCVGHETEAQAYLGGGLAENAFAAALTNTLSAPTGDAATGTVKAGTFTNYHRFVTIFLYYNGAPGTFGADTGLKVKQAQIFREAAYEAGNASALKASQVVTDALDTCCPLLSADRSLIQATSFNLPELAPDEPQTAREIWTAVNALHRWRTRIRQSRIPEFAPQPNAPIAKVGAWGGSKWQDASAGSGEEIYNRALVIGTAPDGSPLTVERWNEASWSPAGVAQPTNPSANVDASGWTPNVGSIARDTSTFTSTPASFLHTMPGGTGFTVLAETSNAVQGIRQGRRYQIAVNARGSGSFAAVMQWLDSQGNALPAVLQPNVAFVSLVTLTAVWTGYAWAYSAPSGAAGYRVLLYGTGAGGITFNFDDVQVLAPSGTLVDRRWFTRTKRLPISSKLYPAIGQQVGDVFLATHARTPLKGAVDIWPTGPRKVQGDEPIHPSEFLNITTELLRLSQLVDPDTGAVGRDGIIATATYTHDDEKASVQLDNDRTSHEALLARMAVVQGSR